MKIIIIGAGASGMMAAIAAAEHGAQVMVLECGNKPGKKIYATGNGKCNFTNRYMDVKYFRGSKASLELVENALHQFGYAETVEYFRKLGMYTKERDGYCYPSTGQASTVAEILIQRCKELGVKIICDTKVTDIISKKKGFAIDAIHTRIIDKKNKTEENVAYFADKVIVATGTVAGGFGCDITGKKLLKKFNLSQIPMVPALAALKCKEKDFFKTAAGVRIDAEISLKDMNSEKVIAGESGELQLTEYGISGIPVFQISRYAAYALMEGHEVQAAINFLPQCTVEELWELQQRSFENYGKQSVFQILSYIWNDRLTKAVLDYLSIDNTMTAQNLAQEKWKKIFETMKSFKVSIAETMPVKNAQICAGGVDCSEISDTFMVKKVPGLFITGELLDVDGICGGYNLQFAWSSGKIAGTAAAEE